MGHRKIGITGVLVVIWNHCALADRVFLTTARPQPEPSMELEEEEEEEVPLPPEMVKAGRLAAEESGREIVFKGCWVWSLEFGYGDMSGEAVC